MESVVRSRWMERRFSSCADKTHIARRYCNAEWEGRANCTQSADFDDRTYSSLSIRTRAGSADAWGEAARSSAIWNWFVRELGSRDCGVRF